MAHQAEACPIFHSISDKEYFYFPLHEMLAPARISCGLDVPNPSYHMARVELALREVICTSLDCKELNTRTLPISSRQLYHADKA